MKQNICMYHFLFNPNYRILRHLILFITGAIITFNQVFIVYRDSLDILGNKIYIICTISFVMYLLAMYFNYFWLTPKFLFKDKYISYAVILLIIVFSLPIFSIVEEYIVCNLLRLPHRITSYTNPLILVDSLSTTTITVICFSGVSVIMFFGVWIKGNEEVSIMEAEHVKSELNKLKGQIAPEFLSKTLKNVSSLLKRKPE